MTDTGVLLELQRLDTRLDQLHHRRATLPERAESAAAAADLDAVDAAVAERETARAAIARELARLEDETATVDAKIAKEDGRLYGGTVTNPKELQAIQDEIAALRRRRSQLDDTALEHLVELEPVDAELGELAARRAATAATHLDASGRLRALETAIDTELAEASAERERIAAAVPAALLAEYQALRAKLGVAAAKLEPGGSCGGCHLKLSAVELDRVRSLPGDAVVHCEECGRILVR